jgi:predicted HTH transcriptional regulator
MLGITERSVERNLNKLQQEELLKRIGPAKGGHWEVTK